VADARVTLEALHGALAEHRVPAAHRERIGELQGQWSRLVDLAFAPQATERPTQPEVIGAVYAASSPRDVVVGAAGSLPGDLHKLWPTRDPKGYHLEYGYSCMGYEIAGGLGVKMAAPDREVYVFVGDGSYLMMASEIVTSIQENVKLTIILVDNHGFGSIGALSRSLGSEGFGTKYRYRGDDGQLSGEHLPVDLAANAASLGAHTIRATTREDLAAALEEAKSQTRTTVIVIETDTSLGAPDSESWWDVPPAEVSEMEAVQAARAAFDEAKKSERYL
jgi:3D-(3,5/4)-trihydroxycyclohexane-1,2-dione acylhydrolase (decyclizing)